MIHDIQFRYTLFHSTLPNHILYACAFLLIISRPTWALPVIFESAGTSNAPMLNSSRWVDPYYTNHRELTENFVSGNVTFRLDGEFYAQRTLNNSQTYPQQHRSLALGPVGEGSELRTNSANYSNVIIQPQLTNYDNTGYVYSYTAPNEGYEYKFKIDSLNRVTDVSEPKGLTLILLAIGALAIARLRRAR